MTTVVAELQTRDARQRELLPPQRLATCHAVVVGVGAVGRQVAIQLASLGMPKLTLIDPDTVEVLNLGPQAYSPQDLGKPKVTATAELVRFLNPDVQVLAATERFRSSQVDRYLEGPGSKLVFSCVDSMEARKFIWETVKADGRVELFLDGRAAGESVNVLAVRDPKNDTEYEKTLFRDEDAYEGSCTARMTVFLANFTAALMVAEFSHWLRDLPLNTNTLANLLAGEMGPI